jgi:hypothetical protein
MTPYGNFFTTSTTCAMSRDTEFQLNAKRRTGASMDRSNAFTSSASWNSGTTITGTTSGSSGDAHAFPIASHIFLLQSCALYACWSSSTTVVGAAILKLGYFLPRAETMIFGSFGER